MNFKKRIPRLLTASKTPGVAIALIKEFEIEKFEFYGFSNIESKSPITENTVFQLASISKPITTWGAMKLVEKGKLDLDTPIEKYLTKWKIPRNYEAYILKKYCNIDDPLSIIEHNEVTVRRILSHSAGLSLSGYPGFHPKKKLPTIVDSLKGDTNDAGDVRVIYEPGKEFHYSGGGYSVLQLIIEEITSQPFAEFMEKEIFNPMGLDIMSFRWREDLKLLTATGYDIEMKPLPNYLFAALAAAGCYSNIKDLSSFVIQSMKNFHNNAENLILKPDYVKLMYKPLIKASFEGMNLPFEMYMGLGHFIIEQNGVKGIYHSGGNHGWRLSMTFIPDSGDGLIMLTNGDNGEKTHLPTSISWLYKLSRQAIKK